MPRAHTIGYTLRPLCLKRHKTRPIRYGFRSASARPSGPIPTFTTRTAGESAHKINI